jgi:large subunit ribosomal protein L29
MIMKAKEIKDLSATELKKKKAVLTEEMFTAKIKNQLGQLGNPLEIRMIRKNLARVHTALAQKTVR